MAGLALLAVVVWVAVATVGTGGNVSSSTTAAGGAIALEGVGSWDPLGDNQEYDNRAPDATDGNETTYWPTETYTDAPSFGVKEGVGLLLDAGRTVSIDSLTVTSTTPGFTARIQAGSDRSGPFHDVSAEQTVEASTTFSLDGADGRYFVVWITSLPPGGSAHVNEVTAR